MKIIKIEKGASTRSIEERRYYLFNPKDGAFAKNIRDIRGDDSEPIESMKQFGWHPRWPALVDENDVVLIGHRRLKVAKQLGIEPVIERLTLGNGQEADAERLKLAIISNVGSKPMTKKDRQQIAKHLYGTKQWTMEKIAAALNVVHSTIVKDLKGFVPTEQTSRSKGGRPKGRVMPEKKPKPKPDPFGIKPRWPSLAELQTVWDVATREVKQEFARANAGEIAMLTEGADKDRVARIADRAEQRSEQQKAGQPPCPGSTIDESTGEEETR